MNCWTGTITWAIAARSGLMRAQALLAEAGWRIRDGVLIGGGGEPLKIEFLSRVPAEQRRLLPYVDALTVLGIESRIRMVESAQYTNRLRNRDYDAFIRIGDFGLPPWELHLAFHSRAVDAPLSFNHAGISHPAVDALVDAAKAAPSLETMAAACRALDRVLLWSFYQIPLLTTLYRYSVPLSVILNTAGRYLSARGDMHP